jgi:hypothetical protein
VYFRPTDSGDGCAGEQIQLWVRRVLLLVLRGAAVLPVRGAAERGAAAGPRAVLAGGGARAHVLGAVPGSVGGARAPCASRCAHRRRTPHSQCAITDPLDALHASSECARFEVIVLRLRASHRHVPRSSDCDGNFY